MKYYINDLWRQINDENEQIRFNAEQQWNDNAKSYSIIYNEVKNQLQKRFINIYEKESGFHDWKIDSICINQKLIEKNNPMEIEIAVKKDSKIYQILFKGVKKISIDYENNNSIHEGFGAWGYSEVLPVDNKTISFEILFSSDASILIHFERLYIKRVRSIR